MKEYWPLIKMFIDFVLVLRNLFNGAKKLLEIFELVNLLLFKICLLSILVGMGIVIVYLCVHFIKCFINNF